MPSRPMLTITRQCKARAIGVDKRCPIPNNLKIMLKELVFSGFVWLTAISTLMAGSLHLTCRCPDGTIKLFCFAYLNSATQNGSGHKSCCAVTGHKICCCHEKITTSSSQKNGGPSFTALGCQKNIVQPEAAVVEAVGVVLDTTCLTISLDSFAVLPNVQGFTPLEWSYHPESSPIDLVLVLQHFLI